MPADIFDTLDAPATADIFDQVAAEPTSLRDFLHLGPATPTPVQPGGSELQPYLDRPPTLPEFLFEPAVNIPRLEHPVDESMAGRVARSAANVGGGFISGASAPFFFAAPEAALVSTIPGMVQSQAEAVREAEKTPPYSAQRIEAGLGTVAGISALGLGAKHAFDPIKAAQIEAELRNGAPVRSAAKPIQDQSSSIPETPAQAIGSSGLEQRSQQISLSPEHPSPESAPSAEIGKPDVFDEVAATRASSVLPAEAALSPQEALRAQSEIPQSETTPEQPSVTSTKNAHTAAERTQRGIAPAEEVAAREFGTVWDEAKARVAEDASAPRRLVESLADNPRALSDTENALLLHRQIEVQNEHDAAVKAVNAAPEDAEAETRLDRVRDDLQATYDAAKSAGTETGRGLNARKMLANADFSLVKMEAETRAVVNKGRPLSPEQAADVAKLHERIAGYEAKIAAYERSPRSIKRVAFQQAKAGRTFNDFLEEQAGKIRERRKPAQPETVKFARQESPNESKSIDSATGHEYSLPDDVRKGFVRSTKIDDAMALSQFARAIEQDKVRRAHRGRAQARLEPVAYDSHSPVDISVQQAELLGRAHGHRVVWLRDHSGEGIDGAYYNGRVFVNVDSLRDPVHAVAGHELVHAMRRNAPELYDQLAKVIAEQSKGRTEAYDANRIGRKYLPEELREEHVADFVGETITDPRQLQEMLRDNPGLYQRAVTFIQDFIDKIKRKLAGVEKGDYPTARETIRNLEKAQRAMREAFREYRASNESASAAVRNLEEVQARIVETLRGKDQPEVLGSRFSDRAPTKSLNQEGTQDLSAKPSLKSNEPSFARQQPKPAESDDVIIGASHIAKGATDYPAWAEAVRQDQVTPTPELYRQAKAFHDEVAPAFRSPEQKRLDRLKTGTIKRAEEYRSRAAAGDFEPRQRNVTQPDAELDALRADAERAKDDFRLGLDKARRSQRPLNRKIIDTFVEAMRSFKLTGITTLGKLGSAGVTRLATTPLEEAIGTILSKSPILSKVAAAAPREGGFSFRAEGRALTSGIAQGLRDAPRILKGQRTDAEVLAGEKARIGSVLDYPGRVHGVIKAPFKEAERARAMAKRTAFAERNLDPSDPKVQEAIRKAANQDAKRAIFMQDNILSEFWNQGIRSLEHSKRFPAGGYALAKVAKFLLPIVKVPTNVAFETMTHLGGTVTASGKLIQVMHRGMKTIRPEEADMIMRHYKKGAIGIALFLTGYFNADKFGGYYIKGEKPDEKDLKHGTAKLFGVNIPAWMLHSPAALVMQAGATAAHVLHGKKPKNEWKAGLAVARGVVEQIPFMAELGTIDNSLADDYKGTSVRGRMLQGAIIPQASKDIATFTDRKNGAAVQRKPQNELDYVKAAIPGLRQQVPTVEDAMRQQKWERKRAEMHRHLTRH